ncbi:MAG: hypothetical protein Q7W38_12000, partial [Deltaproteobacteria bacterium]|nr:hypothetical protein [Deltaproteobacteria bacterium]
QPGFFLAGRFYRDLSRKTLLMIVTFKITADHDPVASEAHDSKRVPFVPLGILLEGRVQLGVE